MIFKIEIETYLSRISKYFKKDILKEKLNILTTFFENIQKPKVDDSEELTNTDILSSERYNNFLNSVERDIQMIRDSQVQVKDKLVSSWNTSEQIKENVFADIEKESVFDKDFEIELDQASVFVSTTLGVKNKVSALTDLKYDPIIQADVTDTSISIYHGKSYGVWIPNDVTSEDGLRPDTKNTSSIVDNKDTFYEIEAVVLQDRFQDVVYKQEVNDNNIVLTAVVKLVFNEPKKVNYVYIKPHNFASGVFYELNDIVISDGSSQSPVDFESLLIDKPKTLTFDSPFEGATSMYLTFTQRKSYYMKYSIGYFNLMGDEYKVDVTGPSLMSNVSDYDDPVSYIKNSMENINTWILDVLQPTVAYERLPELNTAKGNSGFDLIDSRESKRRRWAIGIEDIDVGEMIFSDESEIVTKTYDIPSGTKFVELKTVDNKKGNILYYFSFNNGLDWVRINPIGYKDTMTNFRITPSRIYINSDLSVERKKLNIAGLRAFVDTDYNKLRIRMVLAKSDNQIPEVYDFKPVFYNHE